MKQLSIGVALIVGVLLGAAGAVRSQQGATGTQQTGTQQTGTQQTGTQRIVQFENDDVKVWKSIVVPNAPLTMHRHEHGRVIIPLRGGTMKIVEQSGGSEAQVWETGKAYWLPKNAPNTMHADVNAGDQPIEVMVVELKKDQ
jgi:hypothetical protein